MSVAPASILLTGAGSGIGLNVLTQLLEKNASTRVQVLTLFPTPELTALEEKYGKSRLNTVYGDACDVCPRWHLTEHAVRCAHLFRRGANSDHFAD